jgi:PucR family transcriptional regulator, purine catabolism regulatory protein
MSHAPEEDQEITVAAALRLPPLSDGVPEVLAGAAALENPIRWVHSGEWLEMASVLRGGELLLTTGMALPESTSGQRRFVASLAERAIAGLVIELHTSIDRVPKDVVAEAEARRLPLIALHREIPFVEVTEALHREIVGRQALALERAESAHRRFTELMLEGAGVAEVLAALADLIRNPVVLEKAEEGALYHHPHEASDAAVRAAWDAVVHRLPEAPAHVAVPVKLGRGRTWGTLSALALSAPLRRHDQIVLERGATAVALAMLQRDGEPSLAARQRGQFIARLMNAATVDEREAAAMAAELGFDRRALLRLPVVAVRGYRWSLDAERNEESSWSAVWREVSRELASLRMSAITGVLPGEGLALVLALRSAADRDEIATRISRMLRRSAEIALGGDDLVVCVGAVSRSWTELGAELRDARELSHAVGHAPAQEWFDSTTARIERLLWSLRHDESLHSFVARRLEKLVRHDREHRTQFVATVESYCAHGGRMAETARDLHLQRQSLYKRIERIEDLLGEKLADPDTRLGVELAIRARRYLDALEGADSS